MTNMEPITYPSEVFSRLVPDLYLHRHLNQGLRPATNRAFTQHRKINHFLGGLKKPVGSDEKSASLVWGSSLIQADGMSIVCGVTGSVSEEEGGIFVNVEVLRGANGSSAAMGASQRRGAGGEPKDYRSAQKGIFSCKANKQFFELQNFLKEGQEDEAVFDAGQHQKRYLCLHANVTVLSRNGPVQDYVWAAVLAALKDTEIPLMEIDEDTGRITLTHDFTTIPVDDLDIHSSRSFGFIKPKPETDAYEDDEMDTSEDAASVLLADVQGEVEQAATSSTREGSRLQIVRGREDTLIGFSFVGKGTGVGLNEIKNALDLSKQE